MAVVNCRLQICDLGFVYSVLWAFHCHSLNPCFSCGVKYFHLNKHPDFIEMLCLFSFMSVALESWVNNASGVCLAGD